MNFNVKTCRVTLFFIIFRVSNPCLDLPRSTDEKNLDLNPFFCCQIQGQGLLTHPVNTKQYYRLEERNAGCERSRPGTLLAGSWSSGNPSKQPRIGKQVFGCQCFEDQKGIS